MHLPRGGFWVGNSGRQTDSPKILGMDYFPLACACCLSPLAKQYHSLEATSFKIRTPFKKKKYSLDKEDVVHIYNGILLSH